MKYIIELEDDIKYLIINGRADNRCYTLVRPVAELEILNSDYINEYYGELQDEAYKKGLHDGESKCRYCNDYQRGLEDAWEAAKKLFSSMADSDIEKAFPIEWNNGGFRALMNLQPQEAIAKLKAYEDKRSDCIEVGDEVRAEEGHVFVVTGITDKGSIYGFDKDGMWLVRVKDRLRKTGKHYDIASILEAMRTHD